jgi:hypothetical protein
MLRVDDRLPNPNSLRRAGVVSKTAVLVAAEALGEAGIARSDRLGLYVGQQQSPLDTCAQFIKTSYLEGPRFASPMAFSESVANNAATHLSLTLGLTGIVQTFIGSRAAGIQAVVAAREDLEDGAVDAGLVVVLCHADPLTSDAYNALYFPRARNPRPPPLRFLTGALAFLVLPGGDSGLGLLFAQARCHGMGDGEQEAALRGLWKSLDRRIPVWGSTFSLARPRSDRVLARAIGPVAAPRGGGAFGESFALDPFLQVLTAPPGPRAVACLGEDGTASLLAVE